MTGKGLRSVGIFVANPDSERGNWWENESLAISKFICVLA